MIDSDECALIELDGEQPGTTPARFEIVPLALRVWVPGPSSLRRRYVFLRAVVVLAAGADDEAFAIRSTFRSSAASRFLELVDAATFVVRAST